MHSLGRTIRNLAQQRRRWEHAFRPGPGSVTRTRLPALAQVRDFGANPGALRMLTYAPKTPKPPTGLVVVLHGCTQTAEGYNQGAGWSTLADRYGFALLFPEQRRENNPKLCFNWFDPADIRRDQGEASSIRNMVERMVGDHGIDRRRVFVTGLSAGGAMAAAMLAAYPDVFAAGTIISGLPFGSAESVAEAFDAMFKGRQKSAREWGDLVRGASAHRGSWPRISIWHGDADTTVRSINAAELAKQWSNVHGLSERPTRSESLDGMPRQVWTNGSGEVLMESISIPGLGHGTPLQTSGGEAACGVAGPFMIEAGISSSYHAAKFFGLVTPGAYVAGDGSRPGPGGRGSTSRPADDARSDSGSESPLAKLLRGLGIRYPG